MEGREYPLIDVPLRREGDPLAARQQARRAARHLGFSTVEQARIATAVSESARAFMALSAGRLRIGAVLDRTGRGWLRIELHFDAGAAAAAASVPRHLMDRVTFEQADAGTQRVRMEKALPRPVQAGELLALRRALQEETTASSEEELQLRQQELLSVLNDLQQRQDELRLANQELADTNRGVLALYAELDDRAEQLRRANHLKDQFLSHLSHEFRTPLHSMSMLSRMLLDQMSGPLTGEQSTQVGLIRKAAQDLLEMVNDLLDLAKIEAGKLDVSVEPVDVRELFGALRGMMRPLIPSERVDLVFEDVSSLPALQTDGTKLAQVLRNLVSNALKFTIEGEVRVSAVMNEPGWITFAVADTGIGIPHEAQQRIFAEFEQVQSSIQRRMRGTGLGLSLSQRLAHLLGGRLELESEPGVGSTFRLLLPAVAPTAEPAAPEASRGAARGARRAALDVLSGRRILVIDDDASSRYIVAAHLRPLGAEVLEADSGQAGIALALEHAPAAIVLDLRMPGMDGRDTLKVLQADTRTRAIPVVIFTSRRLDPAETDELEQLTAGVVTKAADQSGGAPALMRALARALDAGAGRLNERPASGV